MRVCECVSVCVRHMSDKSALSGEELGCTSDHSRGASEERSLTSDWNRTIIIISRHLLGVAIVLDTRAATQCCSYQYFNRVHTRHLCWAYNMMSGQGGTWPGGRMRRRVELDVERGRSKWDYVIVAEKGKTDTWVSVDESPKTPAIRHLQNKLPFIMASIINDS